jgi:putative hydrolase of the HAD superfamily
MGWLMAIKAILFDLDDTLVVDEAVSREALASTAARAFSETGAEATRFAVDVHRIGSSLWREGPCHSYTKSIGISFHECLWGRFEGDTPELTALRNWALAYRIEVFSAALRAQEKPDEVLAEGLSRHFAAERRRLQRLMPDALETLVRLKSTHQIALLTNGAPDLQREKIAASGLGPLFDAIAVSGERGVGKPKPEIFHMLLEDLGVSAQNAVMVGNSLERDIAGALNAKLAAAIWIQVPGSEERAEVVPHHTIRGLHEIPQLLEEI